MYKVLDRTNGPEDIKKLSVQELEDLCADVRSYMIDGCSRNPGHLGSSLGAVELIVGLHYVYDSPKDKLVFDVGHQAYAHKILTDRKEAFLTQRTSGGISGFPKMDESPYDAFGVGHSSTSISAALGLAEAARMQGENHRIVALIGDGSLTGGLAFEGLNNAGDSKADLLVILNDNDHSIDANRGSLHRHLLKITSSNRYNSIKDSIWNCLGDTRLRNFLQRWVKSLKSWAVKKTGGDIFEALGFRYFGPIDGNDISQVVYALKKMHGLKGPILLHAVTKKGKGYAPAEADPTTWHAPGKFNPQTGERIPSNYPAARYQDVFGATLLELARKDSGIVGVTPAMASGCGMTSFAKEMPERFFDVGIEEEHAVTFCAGLAAGGLKPVCNIYSAFSQRAYDQIIHDLALQKLPVVLCFDRAGLVGEDGPTHHGAFDLAAYRSIPDVTVSAPANELELRNLMFTAVSQKTGPFIIRYPRGTAEGMDWEGAPMQKYTIGKAERLLEGDRLAIIGIGPCVNSALEAAEKFPGKVGVYNFRFLKPLDTDMLQEIAEKYDQVLTLEDGSLKGGLYGAVCEWMASSGRVFPVKGFGIPDRFMPHGRQADQRRSCGLDTGSIVSEIEKLLEKE